MHITDRIAFIELFWTVVVGIGLAIKTLNFIDAHKDFKVVEESGRNGFRMKLAAGARDTDFLRAMAMLFLWIPGVISLFATNPVNRDPVPWYSYATITCLIVAGVVLTVVSVRARFTRKAVIAEAMLVEDTVPVSSIAKVLHGSAVEATEEIVQVIEEHNLKSDLNSEERREESETS